MKRLMAIMTVLLALTAPKAVQAFDGCCPQGLYLSGFGAASFAEVEKHHHCHNKLKTGYFFSGALGWRLCGCDGLRAEIEGGYHFHEKDHHKRHHSSSSSSSSENHNGSLSSSSSRHRCEQKHKRGDAETWSVLVNFLYDFETCWCAKPFLGAGVGYASTEFKRHHRKHSSSSTSSECCENDCSSSSSSRKHHKKEEDGFAWQLIAGLAYPLCDGWDLSLQYRFFNPVEKARIRFHDVGIGIAYNF